MDLGGYLFKRNGVAAATSLWWICVPGLRRCDDAPSGDGVELGGLSRRMF